MGDDSNAYLVHYGVLGMKWGIRRASKSGSSYSYKSHGQKKYAKKVEKLSSKNKNSKELKKAETKLSVYKQRDKNRQSFVETTAVGKQIVKNYLAGYVGSGIYNRYKAAGEGSTKAIIKTLATATVPVLGPAVGVATSRRKEFKVAEEQLGLREKRSK